MRFAALCRSDLQREKGPKKRRDDAKTRRCQPLEQWLRGNRLVLIPGSIDGNEVDAGIDEAVDAIYRSGQLQPVAFSHGAAIAMWTMMNVADPPLELAQSQLTASFRANRFTTYSIMQSSTG